MRATGIDCSSIQPAATAVSIIIVVIAVAVERKTDEKSVSVTVPSVELATMEPAPLCEVMSSTAEAAYAWPEVSAAGE